MEKFNPEEVLEKLTLEFIGKSPILGIGAMFFSQARQKIFQKCYKSMRDIDDAVDDNKNQRTGIVPKHLRLLIESRLRSGIKSINENKPTDDEQRALINLLKEMDMPIWPWEKLVDSMIYDLSHNGFESFPIFLKYTEGAAVSPGAIFMHLCGARKSVSGYEKPTFDIMESARPLARFSYLVHIIRDFQKDQNNGLNYFSDDLLNKHGLDNTLLRDMASKGKVSDSFRRLIADYQQQAKLYLQESKKMLDAMINEIQPRYLLSLEVLFSLYTQIFERTFADDCNFTIEEMNPTPIIIKSRIVEVVSGFKKK